MVQTAKKFTCVLLVPIFYVLLKNKLAAREKYFVTLKW